MNRAWLLLILLVLIGSAAQVCVNTWPAEIVAIAVNRHGTILACVDGRGFGGTDIWQWSSDLSEREQLAKFPGHCRGLHLTPGSLLISETHRQIRCYDLVERRTCWVIPSPLQSKTCLLGDGQVLLLVTIERLKPTLKVFDVVDGTVLDEMKVFSTGSPLHQVYFDRNRAIFESKGHQFATATWEDNRLRFAKGIHPVSRLGTGGTLYEYQQIRGVTYALPAPHPRRVALSKVEDVVITSATTTSASAIQIVNRESGAVIHRDRLGIATSTRAVLSVFVAVASVFWGLLLVGKKQRSFRRQRWLSNLAILCLFLTVPYIVSWGDLVPERIRYEQWLHLLAIPLGVGAGLLFMWLIGVDRPLYVWAVVFLGCFIPVALPILVTAFGLRLCRFRSPFAGHSESDNTALNRAKLRFGLAEMLLATAAVAILISTGWATLDLLPYGVGVAALLLLGILLSLEPSVAVSAISVAIAIVVACGLGGPNYCLVAGLAMAVLTFSFCQVYGMGMQLGVAGHERLMDVTGEAGGGPHTEAGEA